LRSLVPPKEAFLGVLVGIATAQFVFVCPLHLLARRRHPEADYAGDGIVK
jgi:hypothetical protein